MKFQHDLIWYWLRLRKFKTLKKDKIKITKRSAKGIKEEVQCMTTF